MPSEHALVSLDDGCRLSAAENPPLGNSREPLSEKRKVDSSLLSHHRDGELGVRVCAQAGSAGGAQVDVAVDE